MSKKELKERLILLEKRLELLEQPKNEIILIDENNSNVVLILKFENGKFSQKTETTTKTVKTLTFQEFDTNEE